ncbi:DNA-binding protein [Streptomyces varsoviensis]|uniref:DNA-binding protein n=1 Tax=Streptomyces varsoviensis TaxID=67373 RepID=A0ABR5JB17_9ACTN|nr:DNA-binding protein [Streptomyces varsoviensis]
MQSLARSGGSRALLRWLAARAGGWAGLLDSSGTVLCAAMHHRTAIRAADGQGAAASGGQATALAAGAARKLTERGLRSVTLDGDAGTAVLLALGGPRHQQGLALGVVVAGPLPDRLSALLADVTLPLALCWEAESAERKRRRVDLAESRGREAVLHLLMIGQLATAHQIAGALRPRLPELMRVYVAECPPGRRDEVVRMCADASEGRAWVVRCPVYSGHVIALSPPPPGPAGPLDRALTSMADRALTSMASDCVVGVSDDVPLRETAVGYAQAFHALAIARAHADRYASFGAAPELALVAGGVAAPWARALLAPLTSHAPKRPQDPSGQELIATASSWLAFFSRATAHLKIHRNTLAARLRLIGHLLGMDLDRLADQSALALALRVHAAPVPPPDRRPGDPDTEPAHTLDDLLNRPAVQRWARIQLRPLTAEGCPADPSSTLRTWLEHDAQLSRTAAELGISIPGARKRLTRLEALLERSLLHAPSARHDLWLAFRATGLLA